MKSEFDPKDVKGALLWRVQWLLQDAVMAIGKDGIQAWNALQPIVLKKLALSMAEYFSAERLYQELQILNGDTKSLIEDILEIFCTHRILEDIGEFYRGGFINPDQHAELKFKLRAQLEAILPNLMPMVNALMSPDELVGSSLGHSDRKNLYSRYLTAVREAKGFHLKTRKWKRLFPRPAAPRPRL